MSVQASLRQSKAEAQAEKNWLLQTCLSILEFFLYLWYPGDPPRDAESLGRSLYLWGAVLCQMMDHTTFWTCTCKKFGTLSPNLGQN